MTRRRALLAGLVVLGLLAILLLPVIVAVLQARTDLLGARAALDRARAALVSGELPVAAAELEAAAVGLGAARAELDTPLLLPARHTPLLADQLRVIRVGAAGGEETTRAAARLLVLAEESSLGSPGAVNLTALRALGEETARLESSLGAAAAELDDAASAPLLPPLRELVEPALMQLREAHAGAVRAEAGLTTAHTMLGGEGERRYLLAVTTNAEARAAAGMIGSYGVLQVRDGRIELGGVGRASDLNRGPGPRVLGGSEEYRRRYAQFRPERTWQNITLTPDFPEAGAVMADLFPQSGGERVDGVIAIDPIGLAALLRVTGPVEVPAWPVPITAENAPAVLLNEHYVRFAGEERTAFLASVADAVLERASTGPPPPAEALLRALRPAVAGRHLLVYSTEASEQAALEAVGVAGEIAPVPSDALGVYTQNAGGNKLDYYLHREIRYQVRPGPSGRVRARLEVVLRNTAPAAGLPAYVIGGGPVQRGAPGVNRTIFSVYSPLSLDEGRVNGEMQTWAAARELQRNVYTRVLEVPPGESLTVSFELEGEYAVPYELLVSRQPLTRPDLLTVDVELPGSDLYHTGPLARDLLLR